MSNTFAGQSVYKDLEAAEEKIEQLQAENSRLKYLRAGDEKIRLAQAARIEQLEGEKAALQERVDTYRDALEATGEDDG